MKQFIINEDLANEIMRYLHTKPFGEVWQMVNGLSQIQEVKEKEEPEKAEAAD